MTDAKTLAVRSVVKVMRRALAQDEETPENERLSFRTLCEVALPMLEQLLSEEDK